MTPSNSTESCLVRPAVESDVDAIVALIGGLAEYEKLTDENHADPHALRAHLFGEPRYAEVLIAEPCEGTGAEPLGYALFFHTYSTFLTKPGIFLEDLFVLPERRGKGVGTALLRAVSRKAVERGCGRVEWSVLDWNQAAITFYESIGARPMQEWTGYRLTGSALAGFGGAAG